MAEQHPLKVAVWRYDRTQALFDGRVSLPGRPWQLIDAPLEDIFSRAFDHAEFEVSELSFSNYLRLSVAGKCPYIGVPAFPSRSFRHGAFYVRNGAGIKHPKDLVGRRVGVREYSMTAAMAARGALRDQFGVRAEDITWITGDVDHKEREEIRLPPLYRKIDLQVAPNGQLLETMLLEGAIDALVAYKPFSAFNAGDPRVSRLFEDPMSAEEIYFRQFGIFPIMHLMGIRRDVAESDPALACEIFDVFAKAQQFATDDLNIEQALKISLPWLSREVRRTKAVMGENYWPSGFEGNRKVVERMIDWSFEDGLIPARISASELFVPNLLNT
jgi:4,5-dihydroxyphthalate decarboxylase